MNLVERINEQMKTAMRERQQLELETLRSIKAKLKNFQLDQRKNTVTDEDVITVVSMLVKQRKDSITDFEKGGRNDLVEKEEKELEILKTFLPEELSKEDLEKIIRETISETGAQSKKDLGPLMKAVMPKVKGRADGKEVSQMVSKLLEGM